MTRMWKVISFLLVSILLLSACGKAIEEQAEEGLKIAEETFYEKRKAHNEEVNGTKLYKPVSFKLSEASDGQNIVLNKGKQPFILFINPNEEQGSRLFYDLLHADEDLNIVEEKKFSDGDRFGFAAIIQNEDDTVELIASVGGAKITTLTDGSHITSNLETMMQIICSID